MDAITDVEHVLKVLFDDKATTRKTVANEQAYRTAEAAVARSCRWPSVDADGYPVRAPEELVMAVVLRTARLIARRETPTGVLGVGEFGPVRIASIDRDIEELEAPWRKVVFG